MIFSVWIQASLSLIPMAFMFYKDWTLENESDIEVVADLVGPRIEGHQGPLGLRHLIQLHLGLRTAGLDIGGDNRGDILPFGARAK